ncbi:MULTISPECIES: hypothetical protein [Planktothricoides]|uniref:hypothetical protein n=1 Tax=Planktothricoides TaxID=132607 RepID=UPI001E64AA6D|nr:MULTISPECIES: hypothetical protein [Planktothricoides]
MPSSSGANFHPDPTHPRSDREALTQENRLLPKTGVTSLEASLKGFPPNQSNLLSAIETWLEEI